MKSNISWENHENVADLIAQKSGVTLTTTINCNNRYHADYCCGGSDGGCGSVAVSTMIYSMLETEERTSGG